ncbi:MAG: Fic family protein, partial [Pseudomonadota bacterium]
MPKKLPEDLDARIAAEIARHQGGVGIVDLSKALAKIVSRRTLQRRLVRLTKKGHISAKGEARARVYRALGSVDVYALGAGGTTDIE